MADETPQQTAPEEESKKDTVRINLPPGLGGRPGAPPSTASATTRLKPAIPSAPPEDEAKRETAVIGMPVAAPKPKKDTSRVQVVAPKPAAPEAPRPIVKLKREEPAPAASPVSTFAAATRAPASAPAVAAAPGAVDAGLAIGAIVFSVAVLVYLAIVAMG